MKITIEAEPKEISALVKELEGQKTVASKIKIDGDSITSVCADTQVNSEVKQNADGIRVRISDDTIKDIENKFKELASAAKEDISSMLKEPGGQHHIGIICNGMDINKINDELGKLMSGAKRGAE